MGEKFAQIQDLRQEQKLTQGLTQLQLLHTQLVELPVTQLQERITAEMDDNPALEINTDNPDVSDVMDGQPGDEEQMDYDTLRDREDRETALNEALESIGRDDEELPVYHRDSSLTERESAVFRDTDSFYDQLKEQMGLLSLTEQQHDIMEYLIGSLDDDGLLRKPLSSISDELAVYHNIDVPITEIEEMLGLLQTFDPAGIGARSLQECLIIQIQRRQDSRLKTLMLTVISDYFDAFTKKHWDRIQNVLNLSDLQAKTLFGELRKLNPKPGASLGETIGHSLQQITPDFIIDTHEDGSVTFQLNRGDVPELQVSQSFADSMKEYQQNKEHISRQAKEAILYIKKKVENAQTFIEAVRMRYHTLTVTMQAIIDMQKQFFLDGDEASLRPMILKDVAERTGLDLSTISRVSNSKYAQTQWGIFPLRHFFSNSYTTDSGEELSKRQIKAELRQLIENEDKNKPLSDEILTKMLSDSGFPIARRTVAKYREQMGIPIARLRK